MALGEAPQAQLPQGQVARHEVSGDGQEVQDPRQDGSNGLDQSDV